MLITKNNSTYLVKITRNWKQMMMIMNWTQYGNSTFHHQRLKVVKIKTKMVTPKMKKNNTIVMTKTIMLLVIQMSKW